MSFSDKLQSIQQLQQQIQQHGMLNEEVLKKINYKLRLEWNYTSNSMEGNSLTRRETRTIMVGNITVEGKPLKDVLEMKGHDEVVASIMKMGKGELNISEKRIREVHKTIVYEENPEKQKGAGEWKRDNNYLYNYKDERFDFVPWTDVPERMHQLVNELNAAKEAGIQGIEAVKLSFRFHLEYLTIHPFHDGNGRTARIFTNLILVSYGFPPLYIKENEKATYYQYLGDIQAYGGSPDLFYEFMAGLLLRSQQLVLNAIEGKEIEEPEDWEKKLSLLKKQLAADEEASITQSVNAVRNVMNNSVFPLIDSMIKKLGEFDELFLEKKLFLTGYNDTLRIIKNIDELVRLTESENDDFMNEIGFSYELQGFKRAGKDIFSIGLKLKWYFIQYKYAFFLDHTENSKAIEKLYHQYFTPEEISTFTNECGQIMLQKLEKQLGANT